MGNSGPVAAIPPGIGQTDGPSFNLRAPLYNFDVSNLWHWLKALTNVRLGISDAKLLCVGDSTTAGVGTSTINTVPAWRAWPAQLTAMLNGGGINAAAGLGIPKSASGSQPADNRWTIGSSWVLNRYGLPIGFGAHGSYVTGLNGAGATNALVYADSTVNADTFDVYYGCSGGSSTYGTFTAQATGGAAGTADTAAGTGFAVRKITVSAAAAGTGNSVTIIGQDANKNVTIMGVEPYLSTGARVRVGNAGVSGSACSDWANGSGGTTSTGAIAAYAPDLTIIDLGINDAGLHSDPASFIQNLQATITAAQSSGDVILKTMLPTGASVGRQPLETQYVAAMKRLGLPVIDVYNGIGPANQAAYEALGYMAAADHIHGTDYGYGDVAAMVFAALQAVS